MLTVEALVALILIVVSFFSGKTISDRYHEKIISELQYQFRLGAAQQGVGYVAPPQRRKANIGQQFMERLKENGRAVQQINNR